jgi:hypothetical protein
MALMMAMMRSSAPNPRPSFIFRLILFTVPPEEIVSVPMHVAFPGTEPP